jgi:YHS domain-containing protein
MKTVLAVGLIVAVGLFVAGCGAEKKAETTKHESPSTAPPAAQKKVSPNNPGDTGAQQAPVQGAASAAADKPTAGGGVQTFCPVMWGNPINKDLYADYNGKRVYFCCGYCQTKFKENPEMYIKKLEDAGVTVEKAPVAVEKTTK